MEVFELIIISQHYLIVGNFKGMIITITSSRRPGPKPQKPASIKPKLTSLPLTHGPYLGESENLFLSQRKMETTNKKDEAKYLHLYYTSRQTITIAKRFFLKNDHSGCPLSFRPNQPHEPRFFIPIFSTPHNN